MRFVNRLLAALVALALAVVGVLVVIEVISERLGNDPAVVEWPEIYRWGQRTSLTQGSVRIACIVLAAAGIALLLIELKRRRPTRLAVDSDRVDAAYTRRGVATAIGHAVDDVDGVQRAAVTVRRRRIRIRARTSGIEPYTAQSLEEPVTQAARSRLADLELNPEPRLRVQVSNRRR